MESNSEGNLLWIMDLARTLRQEQLFIHQEQAAFGQLTETLAENSISITKLAYICAQQRRNLNDLIISRPESGPVACCRRANNYENAQYIDAKKVMDYEHAIAFEELFDHLYRSSYLLAVSLVTADQIADITPPLINSVIHTISTGLFGNAINTKDVEMVLKLLRELIEIQIVVSDNPRRLLRANSSAFARLYHRLNESMFSTKIFLTAALYGPIMSVLSVSETILDVDPLKVVHSFSSKERLKRFGDETSVNYEQNIQKFHDETLTKLYDLARSFIDNLRNNWSLFPSTLRWLVQTMCHHLKQAHYSDKIINEIITDMVFTHFICPAIVSPDIVGIVDAPISEQVRFNLMQIGQIIQMLALAKFEDVDSKFAELYKKFEANMVTSLIDLLLVSQSGEDVVAILSQQSDFERSHLLTTQNELDHFIEFFRILMAHEEYDISIEERQKLQKILSHLPETHNPGQRLPVNGSTEAGAAETNLKERSKQSLISLRKATKSKIGKSKSFSANAGATALDGALVANGNGLPNGIPQSLGQAALHSADTSNASNASGSSASSSPIRKPPYENCDNEPILVFSIYNSDETKLQPLTEEEVLKMNSIGQEIASTEGLLVDAESCNLDNTIDKSSVANGFDGIDGMSDVIRTSHVKTTRFSLSHDDGSIGNSDNLEAVSEAPSNHSVTSSLELEENDQNDNLSDMVSANVSGRGTPNISGRDTPSSQVTDGESVTNALPTPQMQKLISKARSDIEDKFCKFEIKKFEGDETVSILSDTWSTDVLASDSETLDASERERDRNFSTPLIPSAVVLPGDNNFEALTGAGGVHRSYLDASDQRSESNWSTDVLASDSEKLAEIDTDDNLSITAKSDITDAGVRSEQERELLVEEAQRPSNSMRGSRGFRLPNGLGRNTAADAGSDRSQEDTAFYDAINLYEDAAAEVGAAGGNSIGSEAEILTSASAMAHYQCLSSLARSSVRTTNQYTGENSFQQNYKSSNCEAKEAFLSTQRMRRQTSAESSISNQSFNLDDTGASAKPPKANHKGAIKKKKNTNLYAPAKGNDSKDLIDFSDFGEEKPATSRLTTEEALMDIFGDDGVEHRHSSIQQRSAGFDGRRNGIMPLKPVSDSIGNISASALRRHQSLNYENHDIIISSIPKRASAMPNLKSPPQTDDDKCEQKHQQELQQEKQQAQQEDQQQEEILLSARVAEMQLNEGEKQDVLDGAVALSHTSQNSGVGVIGPSSALTQKPTKSTGAIPKSISFDASADKTSNASAARALSNRAPRFNDSLRHAASGANSSIFNKLKQGLFKHRRNNKAPRSAMAPTDEFSQSSRSVSFSTNASEMSLDLIAGGRNGAVGYCDITEDILAKYRRKVSTSSETTNSDSTGHSGLARNNLDVEGRSLVNPLHHDKSFSLNIVKKKIRTVLSKTDLHTGDFRHTTYSNASPLLTYLQIQLAQAINLQNFQQISYVSEAIRCISSLEPNQQSQLLSELQNDIQKRQNYLQYLMRYRQNLLLIMENIEQFEARLRSESTTCNRYLMAVCVRLFIEKRQEKIDTFQEEFTGLTMSDDKIDLIEEFIDGLMDELLANGGILHGMPEWQVQEARVSIERILLQRMYQQVMFPNEDADLSRDRVLSEHIRKLQNVIVPSHPALRIPQEFLSESPWPFAQQQLAYISAYKTPREKLQCVMRCISSLMSLLHMSSGRVPAADDILPVLIYIVIMANPPYLLSTIEYVTCFIGEKMDGEEQFHWTLFCSVVKFIKTMD